MPPQQSGFRWLRLWTDHTHGFDYENQSPEQRRRKVLYSLEESGFGYQMVFVAGFGFLTDAYAIFSVNTILPMISVVYWENNMPQKYRLGLNLATLLGSMVGQVTLGYLADRLGRRKVYGLELAFTIMASLGLATSSEGTFNSMSLIGLLIFWRLVMGVGVGSDYPLSAVLTSEYAPAEYRDTMLAAVFFFQPFGQLVAVLVAFAATAGYRSRIAGITSSFGPSSCSILAIDPSAVECARTVDRAWRLVAGLGAVPAILAIYFRFTIPESVYYTLDVKKDTIQAMNDRRFFQSSDSVDMESIAPDDESEDEEPQPQLPAPVANQEPRPQPPAPVANQAPQEESFAAYLSRDQNWRDLFATSVNWMVLDFTFYLLGVNSYSFIPTLFGQSSNSAANGPYSFIISEEQHIMESSSIGALLGSLAAIIIMFYRSSKPGLRSFNSPRRVQIWGFVILAPLFVIVGALYLKLPNIPTNVPIVLFYQLCQLFFNLGPNTTTFIIPAQIFPTRFRCTCYGISAAMGKLGSVFGQLVVNKVLSDSQSNRSLGGTLIGFAAVMLLGAALSKFITPETCDSKGVSLELDDLGERRTRRKVLQQREKDYRGEALEMNQNGAARRRHS